MLLGEIAISARVGFGGSPSEVGLSDWSFSRHISFGMEQLCKQSIFHQNSEHLNILDVNPSKSRMLHQNSKSLLYKSVSKKKKKDLLSSLAGSHPKLSTAISLMKYVSHSPGLFDGNKSKAKCKF